MKVIMHYEYNEKLRSYDAWADTSYGKLTGSSWESFDRAKLQIVDELEKLRNRPEKASEEIEV